MSIDINKLYKARIQSGNGFFPDNETLYVIAKSYAGAEKILLSDKNLFWKWNHGQRIAEIEEIKEPVIIN